MRVAPLKSTLSANSADGDITNPSRDALFAAEKWEQLPIVTNPNETPALEKAPLTERLRPFRYRPEAGSEPLDQHAIPDGFTPTGGCNLPHNATIYRSSRFGNASVNALVFAGTNLPPQSVDRNKGLLAKPQKPTTRALSSFRRDERGNNRALGGHITGYRNRGYQSSSSELGVAKTFSINRGNHRTVPSGWVYSAIVSGVDVPRGREMDKLDKRDRATTRIKKAPLPYREALSGHITTGLKDEKEIAVPDGIVRDDIIGLRKTKRGSGDSKIRFVDTVWVDPNLPDAWYNRVGQSLLNKPEPHKKQGGVGKVLTDVVLFPFVLVKMLLGAPGLLGGLLIAKANEAVHKGTLRNDRGGKLLIAAGMLGRGLGSVCKIAVPVAMLSLGLLLPGVGGALILVALMMGGDFAGDLTSLFMGDFLKIDTFEATPDPLYSAKEGEEVNGSLLVKLRGGVEDGTGIPGLRSVKPTAFKGITHQQPGLKIELELGADLDATLASINEANPEFSRYTFVDQYPSREFLSTWFNSVKRRPVVVFRLDTSAQ